MNADLTWSYVSPNQNQCQTYDFKNSPCSSKHYQQTCAPFMPGKISLAGKPQRKRMGNKALSDEHYLIEANLNLVRYKKLMDAEVPKSTAWRRLKKAYISQEVRIRSRIKKRQAQQSLSKLDDVMQEIINQVAQVVKQATLKKIVS